MYGALTLLARGTAYCVQVCPPSAVRASTPCSVPVCAVPLTYTTFGSSAATSSVLAFMSAMGTPNVDQVAPSSVDCQICEMSVVRSTATAMACAGTPGTRETSAMYEVTPEAT